MAHRRARRGPGAGRLRLPAHLPFDQQVLLRRARARRGRQGTRCARRGPGVPAQAHRPGDVDREGPSGRADDVAGPGGRHRLPDRHAPGGPAPGARRLQRPEGAAERAGLRRQPGSVPADGGPAALHRSGVGQGHRRDAAARGRLPAVRARQGPGEGVRPRRDLRTAGPAVLRRRPAQDGEPGRRRRGAAACAGSAGRGRFGSAAVGGGGPDGAPRGGRDGQRPGAVRGVAAGRRAAGRGATDRTRRYGREDGADRAELGRPGRSVGRRPGSGAAEAAATARWYGRAGGGPGARAGRSDHGPASRRRRRSDCAVGDEG